MKVDIPSYEERDEAGMQITIHKWDTWNMDHTLALIILPMLKQLKEEKHGSPCVDNEDVPEHLRMPEKWKEERYNVNGETDPHFFDRWDYVMNEMIYAFQAKLEDDPDFFFEDEEPQYEMTEINFKGIGPAQFRLFPDEEGRMEDYEFYEWVSGCRGRFDKEAYTKYHERVSNGFRLFGKYYESLWD